MARALQAQIDEENTDSDKAGGVKVLWKVRDIKPAPGSPKELMTIEVLAATRDTIAHTMEVPLPVLGVIQDATFSSSEEHTSELQSH